MRRDENPSRLKPRQTSPSGGLRALSGSRSRRWLNRLALVIAAHCLALPVAAQTVVDGDSIELNGKVYRLHGIADDGQVCPDGWPAAHEAEAYLDQMIGGKAVTCMPIGLPRGNETNAICRADGIDVGAAMVTGGMAYAFVPHSVRYITQEDAAARANRGIHGHKCLRPWAWRSFIKQAD